jgi:hypothetical protein
MKIMTVRLPLAAFLLGMLPGLACAQTPEPASEPPAAQVQAPPVSGLHVEYDGEKLTITAANARLGDLLAAISERTSIHFDLPDSLASLSVTAEAGPAGLRDALVALLKKAPVDYAMAGSSNEPDELGRVVILARRKKPAAQGDSAAATATEEAKGGETDGASPDAYQMEERLIREAREAEKAASKAEEPKPADEKTIEPTETGEPRIYQSGLSETEATMTPEELYRHWLRSREEQQRKLREAQAPH